MRKVPFSLGQARECRDWERRLELMALTLWPQLEEECS